MLGTVFVLTDRRELVEDGDWNRLAATVQYLAWQPIRYHRSREI